jgi:hypothetical protein
MWPRLKSLCFRLTRFEICEGSLTIACHGYGVRRRRSVAVAARRGVTTQSPTPVPRFSPRRLDRRATSVFRKVIVWIAVHPPLPGLCRGNHRMSTGARMRRGVAVWRAVATQGRATRLTRPQMNPLGADLDALIAFLAFRMGDSCDRTEMRTDWV